jgi:hypothetical protein
MHKVSHPAHGSLVAHADLIVIDDDPLQDLSKKWRARPISSRNGTL